MPELPEVETVMRGLSARLLGRTITHAATHRPDMRWPFPQGLAARIQGSRIGSFRRRAKYILMRLSERDGTADSVLIHLGMSGRMNIAAVGANEIPLHEHVTLHTDDGWRIGFVDPRRFGSVDLIPTAAEDQHRLLQALGPEPLGGDFNAKHLQARLAGRATPIKAALLDQSNVAGLGNIYVCEALFRASISPERLAGSLTPAEIKRLVRVAKQTLVEAIAAGGSTLRDYAQPDGELGYFQHAFRVYGRIGEPCEHCPGPPKCSGIQRIVQSGRSSFYCPRTQR
jgi:formamidopyrimidine-DNA glycosylase